jgi:hypothetical protein
LRIWQAGKKREAAATKFYMDDFDFEQYVNGLNELAERLQREYAALPKQNGARRKRLAKIANREAEKEFRRQRRERSKDMKNPKSAFNTWFASKRVNEN